MHGTYSAVAKALGIHLNTVKKAVLECQLDPAFAHTRAQAYDEISGKVADVASQVLESITPEELTTTHHKVYDACGNLLRVVSEGPSLKDKAFAASILMEKHAVIQQARQKALELSGRAGGAQGLLMPESIEDMRAMLASKVKSLRLIDINFENSEFGQQAKKMMREAKVTEQDIQEAVFEPLYQEAPFDG